MNRKTKNYIALVDKLKTEYTTLHIKRGELQRKYDALNNGLSELPKLIKEARTKELATEIKLAALMIAALHKSKKVSASTNKKGFTDNQTYANAIKEKIIKEYRSLLAHNKVNPEIKIREWEIIPRTKYPNSEHNINRNYIESDINSLVRAIERDISRGAVKKINDVGTVTYIDWQLEDQNRKEGKRMSTR